ncbi:MAG: DUF4832 domain-containing protein [Lachnospiraceae bacterium]|nr:DUF4832 domain-containing protein [Lachnospiraceae bacterium]
MKHSFGEQKGRYILGVVALIVLYTGLALVTKVGITQFSQGVYENYHVTLSYTPADYGESANILHNPFMGFYRMEGYLLQDSAIHTQESIQQTISMAGSTRLSLLLFNLREYREGDISSTGLEQLDFLLDEWQRTGRQLILRFEYDWDGKGEEQEPDELSIILRHMEQVAPIVNEHRDAIYLLQGIFVGNYGEMHGSAYLDVESMRTLATHWAKLTDPSLYLAVRTPAHWRTLSGTTEPLLPDELWQARIGLYNDGMLGSETDVGTYSSTPYDGSDLTQKGTREQELSFQQELCEYVPNGGEVVIANPYNDFDAAVVDLARMHISYLNNGYDAAVLSKWQDSVYDREGVFHGVSGYDYIEAHMGYRYVLRGSELDEFWPLRHKDVTLSLIVENVGFAPGYRTMEVRLLLRGQHTQEEKWIPIDTDTRDWKSQAQVELRQRLPVRELNAEPYDVYLQVVEPSTGEVILFGNTLMNEDVGMYIGTLTIG